MGSRNKAFGFWDATINQSIHGWHDNHDQGRMKLFGFFFLLFCSPNYFSFLYDKCMEHEDTSIKTGT